MGLCRRCRSSLIALASGTASETTGAPFLGCRLGSPVRLRQTLATLAASARPKPSTTRGGSMDWKSRPEEVRLRQAGLAPQLRRATLDELGLPTEARHEPSERRLAPQSAFARRSLRSRLRRDRSRVHFELSIVQKIGSSGWIRTSNPPVNSPPKTWIRRDQMRLFRTRSDQKRSEEIGSDGFRNSSKNSSARTPSSPPSSRLGPERGSFRTDPTSRGEGRVVALMEVNAPG